jgi:hypothetical protein
MPSLPGFARGRDAPFVQAVVAGNGGRAGQKARIAGDSI